MRRRASPQTGERLRAELAAKLRLLHAEYYGALYDDPEDIGECPKAAALERGEPVEFAAWELPPEVRRGFGPHERVVLQPDGSLVPADASPQPVNAGFGAQSVATRR